MSIKNKFHWTIGMIKRKDLPFVGLLLAFILIIFFSQTLLSDQVLSAANGVFSTPFFSEIAPQGYTQPANSLLFDQVYQFIPWRKFSWESLRSGQLPIWNPYSLAGTPFLATMQSSVFYPINLLFTSIPFEKTFLWSAFLRLWIAGFFTYLLARYYRLGIIASLVSAISFMLSGFLVVWLGHPQTNVAIWLPALILFAEILLRATQNGKILRIVCGLALIIAIQFTGGHIETSMDILVTFGLYYLFRWFMIILPLKRSFAYNLKYLVVLPGAAVFLGTSMAGAQLAPFLEWLPLSSEFQNRGGFLTRFQWIDTSFWHHLLELPVILFPNLFNNPT